MLSSVLKGRIYEYREVFPDKRVVNLGYSGDDISGMCRRVEQIAAVNPDYIFIMAGINNMKYDSVDKIKCLYSCLIDTVKYSIPESKIFIRSILSLNNSIYDRGISNDKITRTNVLIRSLAKEKGAVYVDLTPYYKDGNGELRKDLTLDGIHLKPSAYKNGGS